MNKRRRYLAKRRRAQVVKNIRFWHHGLDAVIRMATMTVKRFDVPDGYGFSIERLWIFNRADSKDGA